MPDALILLELNEINFDVARLYALAGRLPNFSRLFAIGVSKTCSEHEYQKLEPWIQWVSAHTGMTAQEHGIFRLGDIVERPLPQIFEQVESAGYKVGAVSPMNVVNQLRSPAYFVPDPWTETRADSSWWSRAIWRALNQTVNDNSSGRISVQSAMIIVAAFLRFSQWRHWPRYVSYAARSVGAPWRKAMFLDLLIHNIHLNLFRKHKPDFSALFVNAGAHIQHHYFFNSRFVEGAALTNPAWYVNSDLDPLGELLELYDCVLGDYLSLADTSLVIATGLTQVPYDRVKFYYRLQNHEKFLSLLGIRCWRVLPRMTRDFVVEFSSAEDCQHAERILASAMVPGTGERLFDGIDNRGLSLFVTLTYAREIDAATTFSAHAASGTLKEHVVFVAIKNGMHSGTGFLACTGRAAEFAPADGSHIRCIHKLVTDFFKLKSVGDLRKNC